MNWLQIPSPSELQTQGRFGVYFPCMTSEERVVKEGRPEEEWKRTRVEYTYNGWGNVTLTSDYGVVDEVGDEMFDEAEYYVPSEGARWFIGLPLVSRTWAVEGSDVKAETNTYYDGGDFVGSQTDITHGFVSRMTEKASDGVMLERVRAKRDEHGNVIETIMPNGSIAQTDAQRRRYIYDDTGLFLTHMEVQLSADRMLRRSTQYEPYFQKMTHVTDWVVIEGGEVKTPSNDKSYTYDDFGRMVEQFEPNDPEDAPSVVYSYDLGAPFSKIVVEARSERGGALTERTYRCVDGAGRQYQTRTKLPDGRWTVTGMSVFNSRGVPVEILQPYTSERDDCETQAPTGVLSSTLTYDAQFRTIETTEPGEGLSGETLKTKTVFAPLKELTYDSEDLDPSSAPPRHPGGDVHRRGSADRSQRSASSPTAAWHATRCSMTSPDRSLDTPTLQETDMNSSSTSLAASRRCATSPQERRPTPTTTQTT